mmetsp:Transcript_39784/g.40558  ORF Transcript_39784/g.40558 Transcript_39784/m.40558 type:complete len:117 (+) Transcript_39784:250-600(+)
MQSPTSPDDDVFLSCSVSPAHPCVGEPWSEEKSRERDDPGGEGHIAGAGAGGDVERVLLCVAHDRDGRKRDDYPSRDRSRELLSTCAAMAFNVYSCLHLYVSTFMCQFLFHEYIED